MHRKSTAILASLLAIGIALIMANTAAAHSRPVRFDPAPGSVLEAAPAQIQGWFSSDLRRADESFIRVLNDSGQAVAAGTVTLSTDRRSMSVGLQPGLGGGRYLVHWSTHDDADGEVFAGCYTFFVGQAAADAAIAGGDPLDGGADCPATASHGHEETASMSSIEIDVPAESRSRDVTLKIEPSGFTPRAPAGSGQEDGFGHYHIYLDKAPLDVIVGHTHEEDEGMSGDMSSHEEMSGHDASENPGGLVENPVMWVENSYTFKDLDPGWHTVSVALFYDDHSPYSPPVVASRSFRVLGEEDGSGVPVWTVAVGLVLGIVGGAAGFKLLGRA